MTSQYMMLNKILATKDYSLISLNNLSREYFFNYKAEFDYIKNHYELYGNIPDKLTFVNVFPEFELVDVNEPDTFLLEQLYKDYNTAYMARSFNTVKKYLENGDTDKAMKQYTDALEGLHRGSVMTCTNLLTDTSRFDQYVERTMNKKSYISTGFKELDEIIGGIDRENEDLVIAARTGIGKTQTMCAMACAASMQGLTVGIYEGEMTASKLGYRIDTFLGHIENTAMNRGQLWVKNKYADYIEKLPSCNYGAIKVLTPNDVAGPVTVSTLRAFVEREHLDILFVDQYSLLDDESGAKVKHEQVGNIARDIKKLQVEKKIPVVAVSQMNRTKNEDKTLDTTQIGLSDMIPQYATVLIMLDRDKDLLNLNIVKARDGGEGKLTYKADWNVGTFEFIPDSDSLTEEEAQQIKDSYNTGESTPF